MTEINKQFYQECDDANDLAGTMTGFPTDPVDSPADITGQATDKAQQATDKARDLTSQAGEVVQDKTDQGMDKAAEGLGQAANLLRSQGEQRTGTVGTAATRTADTLESASQYLRQKNSDQVMNDLEALVRRRPAESLLVAAGVGYLLSKVLT